MKPRHGDQSAPPSAASRLSPLRSRVSPPGAPLAVGRELRYVRIAALLMCFGLFAVALLILDQDQQQQQPMLLPPPIVSGVLPLAAPPEAQVGEAITVTVGPAPVPDGAKAVLTAIGSYGPRMYRAAFTANVARFLIPGEDTRESGAVVLIATVGMARGQAQLMLRPGSSVDPIVPLVGSRTIVADGKHWSMVVAIPFDSFGNPVAEGTPVEARIQHPDGRLEKKTTPVRHLLSWARVTSSVRAGRTPITVTADQAHGPEGLLLEVPGWPITFTLTADPPTLAADGYQLSNLRTSIIYDRFGNPMPDGTLVRFVVDMPDGSPHMIPAYTIDGAAGAPLQAARQPGIATIRATIYGIESAPLQVAFTPGPAIGVFPLAARVDSAGGAVVLEAGPLLGPLDQFIPDGTPVLFRVVDATGRLTWASAQSDGGRAKAELRLALLAPGDYDIEALAGSGRGQARLSIPANKANLSQW